MDRMKQYALAYGVTMVTFLSIDALWLTFASERLYKPHLSRLLADQFSLAPAALFYFIYIAGILIFAISPALKADRWTTAAIYGAAFGFCAYATYDLTNQATLRDWPVLITVVDLAWGTVLTATAATVGYLATATR
jgi:uncharacterized membrane protein